MGLGQRPISGLCDFPKGMVWGGDGSLREAADTAKRASAYFSRIEAIGDVNMSVFTYPTGLAQEVRRTWLKHRVSRKEKVPALPNDEIIDYLLEVAYHASFLTEEKRRLGFKLAFCTEGDISMEAARVHPDQEPKLRSISFSKPRDFSVSELLRLAPATDPRNVLICVQPTATTEGHALEIWGLVDSGSSWWNFLHGESGSAYSPPNCLTVSSSRPGQLTISRQGSPLFTLRTGKLTSPIHGVLKDGPVGLFFRGAAMAFYDDVTKDLGDLRYDPEGADDIRPFVYYANYLERLLFRVQELGHGGTFIIVPDALEASDSRLMDRAIVKYSGTYNSVWPLLIKELVFDRRYYEHYFGLWDSKKPIERDSFRAFEMIDAQREELGTAISDSLRFLASLSGVDGAVILTDRLRLIGFGAEVTAQSPNLERVRLAIDAAGLNGAHLPIDNYGTRHRSAFRFCSSFEPSVVFVISQDGGLKAIKRVGPEVVMWPDVGIDLFDP